MEIRVLRYFLEAAREENITKAAAYLHISQPTLSKQLKDLEQEQEEKMKGMNDSSKVKMSFNDFKFKDK